MSSPAMSNRSFLVRRLTCLFWFAGWLLLGQQALWGQSPVVEAESLSDFYRDEPTPNLTQRLEQLEAAQRRFEESLAQSETTEPLILPPNFRLLPDYVYSPSYYNTEDVGARPLADYAPPGYEARDQQEGPAVPEYTRIYPAQVSETGERIEFVTRGLYPGSFLAPGTNTSFRLRGFVRLAGMFDFDPVGVQDAFVTNSIPVPQGTGQNFNMSGRISRFALESWTPTNFCDWNIHTFIEADFFNGAGQAAGGGGNPLRLRHAFFDFGYFRFGQQNTVFMDASAWPSLVDFQGPNSWVNQRQPSMRVTVPLGNRMYWAASMERPFSDMATVDANNVLLGANVQDVPDFAMHWRYEGDRGHLQIGGLLRTIGFRPTGESVIRETASGINASAVVHPWAVLFDTDPLGDNPTPMTRSRLLAQVTTGAGVGRYLNDLAGQRLDAQYDAALGELRPVEATGWNVSYEQWFSDYFLSNVTYSHVDVDNNRGLAAAQYESAQYIAASLWWIPVPRLSCAVEFMDGERKNFDGESGRAQRLNGLAQYNF
jgi:hypothetical protein